MKNKKDYIFGVHPITEALNEGKDFGKILIQSGLKGTGIAKIKSIALERQIPISTVPVYKLNKITRQNHQGLIGFTSPISFASIETLLPTLYETGQTPLLIILDQVTDVRNFGAIARTALAMKAHALIIPLKGAATVGGDAIKTSAGALFKIPVCRVTSLDETIDYLRNSGVQSVACSEKATQNIAEINFTLPTAIILGSEDTGVSNSVLRKTDHLAKVPIASSMDSLNVSVATGMVLYECNKQRS